MITDFCLFVIISDLGKATSCWKAYLDMLKELIYMMFCQKHPYVKAENFMMNTIITHNGVSLMTESAQCLDMCSKVSLIGCQDTSRPCNQFSWYSKGLDTLVLFVSLLLPRAIFAIFSCTQFYAKMLFITYMWSEIHLF